MKRYFYLVSILLVLVLLFSMTACNTKTDELVPKWFMKAEFDEVALCEEDLLSEINALDSDKYEVVQVEGSENDAFSVYIYIYSGRETSSVIFFDSVSDAKAEYDVYTSIPIMPIYPSTVYIRVNNVLFMNSGVLLRPILEKLPITLTDMGTAQKQSEKTRIRGSITINEIISYMKSNQYEIQDDGSGIIEGMKEDGSCPFILMKNTFWGGFPFTMFYGFLFTMFYNDYLTDNGEQIYYGRDYAVLCIGDDWLTILDEAEAYYAETE